MPKFLRNKNSGIPVRQSLELDISGLNISPDAITADTPAVVFDYNLLENYDTFNVDQDTAATDLLQIPDEVPVGSVFRFITDANPISIETPSTSSVLINNNAAGTDLTITANSIAVFIKKSATAISAFEISNIGAIAALA